MKPRARLAALALCATALAGCAHYPVNVRQTAPSGSAGHRFPALIPERPDPADALFVCLSFSGGGTRAAAFAHGALLYLKTADIGGGRTLLDEVDCIAGISGGAFMAAYYGLFGRDGLDTFPQDFLKRDIETELISRTLNPYNLARLASPYFSRIDLAAELYHETVFQRKTFASLRPRPFVILHATNMANGAPFEFTQAEFDFLGSDLDTFPVARAVAASSAFPFLLSPVSLRSFDTPPGYTVAGEINSALRPTTRELNPARYYRARHQLDLMTRDPRTPAAPGADKWVHLLDGGLADNIGLRSILRAYDRGFLRDRINEKGHVKRLVVIAVNARTDPPETLSRREASPGLVDVFAKTATVAMETVTFDTIGLALERQTSREQAQTDIRECNTRLGTCPVALKRFDELAQEIRTCFVHIDFEGLPSPRRETLLAFPTSFALTEAQVAELQAAAADLLRDSAPLKRLLDILRTEPSLGAGIKDQDGKERWGNCF